MRSVLSHTPLAGPLRALNRETTEWHSQCAYQVHQIDKFYLPVDLSY